MLVQSHPTTYKDKMVDATYGSYLRLIETKDKEKIQKIAIGAFASIFMCLLEYSALHGKIDKDLSKCVDTTVSNSLLAISVHMVMFAILVPVTKEILCRNVIPALLNSKDDGFKAKLSLNAFTYALLDTKILTNQEYPLLSRINTIATLSLLLEVVNHKFGIIASIAAQSFYNIMPVVITMMNKGEFIKIITTAAITVLFSIIVCKATEPFIRNYAEKADAAAVLLN